jgi:Ca2+/Na+ antiporter
VLPEYAIGLHYAWTEGLAGTHEGLAVANMTGANRILIGVGWALIAIVYYFKHGKKEVPLDNSQGLELSLLLLATIYSLVIPLKGRSRGWTQWCCLACLSTTPRVPQGAKDTTKKTWKVWLGS